MEVQAVEDHQNQDQTEVLEQEILLQFHHHKVMLVVLEVEVEILQEVAEVVQVLLDLLEMVQIQLVVQVVLVHI
jgi:hypothetical protein